VSVQRQCARSGCSAVATATFTFDAQLQTVWLDAPRDGNARAGELCERHAGTLTPPQGWRLDDRRRAAEPVTVAPAPAPDEHCPAPSEVTTGALELLLRARSPLLARAFQSAGNH
jgi:Protein of unknown function (DUF3499)